MKMVVIISVTTKTEVYCNAIPTVIQAMLLVLVLVLLIVWIVLVWIVLQFDSPWQEIIAVSPVHVTDNS